VAFNRCTPSCLPNAMVKVVTASSELFVDVQCCCVRHVDEVSTLCDGFQVSRPSVSRWNNYAPAPLTHRPVSVTNQRKWQHIFSNAPKTSLHSAKEGRRTAMSMHQVSKFCMYLESGCTGRDNRDGGCSSEQKKI
jgi:hypothetical protein